MAVLDVIRLRGRVIDENLAHALPKLSAAARKRLARRMWEHLFLLVWEVAHAPRKIHETNWREYMRLNDVAPLLRAMISGRPVIIVTAHFGNFELGGFGLGILGFPTYSVARPLDNRYLDRFLARFRGVTGQHLIPKNGGSAQIEHVLSHGGVMGIRAYRAGVSEGFVSGSGRLGKLRLLRRDLGGASSPWVVSGTAGGGVTSGSGCSNALVLAGMVLRSSRYFSSFARSRSCEASTSLIGSRSKLTVCRQVNGTGPRSAKTSSTGFS